MTRTLADNNYLLLNTILSKKLPVGQVPVGLAVDEIWLISYYRDDLHAVADKFDTEITERVFKNK